MGELSEQAAQAAVEDALRTEPLQVAPPDLYPAVMALVRTRMPPQSKPPRFRLSWLDVALGLFATVMITLVVSLGQLLPAELQLELSWALQQLGSAGFGIGAVVSAGVLLCALALSVAMLVIQPGLGTFVARSRRAER